MSLADIVKPPRPRSDFDGSLKQSVGHSDVNSRSLCPSLHKGSPGHREHISLSASFSQSTPCLAQEHSECAIAEPPYI